MVKWNIYHLVSPDTLLIVGDIDVFKKCVSVLFYILLEGVAYDVFHFSMHGNVFITARA